MEGLIKRCAGPQRPIMNTNHTIAILLVSLALIPASLPAEVVLEDDFYQGQPGPISGRQALKGGVWQGVAVVAEGVGLHHGGDSDSRSAFVPLTIPPNARKIIVTIEGVMVGDGMLSYGFTDNPQNLTDHSGNHQGLIWSGLGGGYIRVRGGPGGQGSAFNSRHGDFHGGDVFQMQLTAERPTRGTSVPVSLSLNGLERFNVNVQTAQAPRFSHFFISFSTGINPPSQKFVYDVKVEAE